MFGKPLLRFGVAKARSGFRLLAGFLVAANLLSVACGQGSVKPGFVIETWLSNIGDLGGVTVGPGESFGTDPYVYSKTQQAILRVTGKDTTQEFATAFGNGTGRIAFDPSGEFGNNMFVCGPFDGGGPHDPIYQVSSSGNVSIFAQDFSALTSGIAFGQGAAFGNSLYVPDSETQALQRYDANANHATFGSGLLVDGASWQDDLIISDGGSLGDYAYVTDGIHHRILRMSPSGTVTEFATVEGAHSMAIGQGPFGDYLYVGTSYGSVYQVDSQGNADLFAWGFGIHTPEGNFRGLDVAGNTMWLTSDIGILYRVTPVPEPSTLVLLGAGVISLLAWAWRQRR